MVRGEIELARQHAATHATPHILPVRIQFDGPLPYPLNAYLDAIQYATWKGPQETPQLLQELLAAMANGIATEPRREAAAPIGRRQPAAAVRRAAARSRRRARCRGSLVSAPACGCDGAGRHSPAGADAHHQGPAPDGQELAADAHGESRRRHRQEGRAAGLPAGRRKDKGECRSLLPAIRCVDRGAARAPRHGRRALGRRVLQPAELHPLRRAADPAAAGRAHAYWRSTRRTRSSARISPTISSPCSGAGTACAPTRSAAAGRSWTSCSPRPPSRSSSSRDRTSRRSTSAWSCRWRTSSQTRSSASTPCIRGRSTTAPSSGSTRSSAVTRTSRARRSTCSPAARRPARSTSCSTTASEDSGPFGDHLRYYLLRLQRKPELITALRQVIDKRGGRRRTAHPPARGGRPRPPRAQSRRRPLRALRALLPRAAS